MKRLIAAMAVLAVTSLHAEELKFGDLNYFIKQNQSNVLADLNRVLKKVTSKGGDTLMTKGYVLETRYGYGITNQFNAYVGIDYAYKYETQNKTTPSQDIQSSGLSNPLLALNYRLLNQNSSQLNFDLGLVGKFNVQDSETGSGTGSNVKDGNYIDGRSSYELNARIGRKWNEANEWQLAVGALYHATGETEVQAVGGNVDRDLEASTDFYARASYQYRPVNEFMILLSGQATEVGETESKEAGVKTKEDSHLDFEFIFVAKYLLTDNCIVKFNMTDSYLPSYDRKSGGTKVEQQKRISTNYGIGVEFVF